MIWVSFMQQVSGKGHLFELAWDVGALGGKWKCLVGDMATGNGIGMPPPPTSAQLL